MSKTLSTDDSSRIEEKTFYILLIFSKTKETKIDFKFSSKKTERVLLIPETISGGFRYNIILKHVHTQKNPSEIIFENNGEIFRVSFNPDEGTFIFNPTLKIKKNKTSSEKAISQKNVIKITEKIDIFTKYLIEAKEDSKVATLYNDGVTFFNLSQDSKDFELAIYLFIKVCSINHCYKDTCINLLKYFWENTNDEKIDKLTNQNESCKQFLEKMIKIETNSEKLINENGFDKAQFYGLILFYYNTYGIEQFQLLSKKLQERNEKEKGNFFFDILIHFSSSFSNDVNINLEYYINYLLKKEFELLKKSGFSYFKRAEEFIHIIHLKKEEIIGMKDFKTLNMPVFSDYNLENPETFIEELKGIIEFPKAKEKIFLYLPGSFWKKINQTLIKPSPDNISNLFHLRENFKNYLNIVKANYKNDKKESVFYSNANQTDQKDELGASLHKMIEKYINEDKDITNITNDEIINQISKFDPYYDIKEDIYEDRRELNFIDKINFDDKDKEWIDKFKEAKFENIFKNFIEKYIQKLISKINKTEDLGIVISLINENEIKELDKMDYLLRELKKKAIYCIKNHHSINETKTRKNISALSSLFKLFYNNTKKLEKIKDILVKLNNKDKHLIFLELLKEFNNDDQMKNYIFDFYINNLNTYYENIRELFNIMNEGNIKDFMEKISNEKDSKNYRIISFEKFFTEKESLNLNLLQELSKEINLIENTGYYGKTLNILKNIYSKINKDLEIKYLKSLLNFSEENIIKRFKLLNIHPEISINPKEKHTQLKQNYEKALKQIKELKDICNALKVFHRDYHKDEIKGIEEIITRFDNGKINEFYNIEVKVMELGDEIKKRSKKLIK